MRHAPSKLGIIGTTLLTSALFANLSSAQSTPVVFAGTEHLPLSGAVLSVDPSRTVLTIDGLSAGGGLTYQLDAEAGSIGFGDGIRGTRPSSGTWNVHATYRYGGGLTGEVVGGVNAAGDPLVTFDQASVGTNSVAVTLNWAGQVVASFDYAAVVTLRVDEWPAEAELGIDQGEMLTGVHWDVPVVVFLPDGSVVDCDEAVARSQTGGALGDEELGTMAFEAFGLGPVKFEGERFRDDTGWFEVVGNLLLERTLLGHELSHVVQGGPPGTYVEFPLVPCVAPDPIQSSRVRAGLQFESLLASGSPEIGTRTDFLVYGEIGGQGRARIPTHSKEWTNYNESDPGMTLIGGFTELGAVSWTVQVFDDGLLVDSESGLGQAAARVKEYVGQADQTDLDFLNQRAAANIDLGGDQEVTILATVPRTVIGDRVHIIPEQIQIFPDCVEAVGTQMHKVSDVTLKRGVIGVPLPSARALGLNIKPLGDLVLVKGVESTEAVNKAWGAGAGGPLSGAARISMAGLRGMRWDLAGDLDPLSIPEGSQRSFRLRTQDVTGQPGSAGLDVVVENGQFSVAHDFDDLGSSDADVTAFLNGQVVYSGILPQQGRVLVDTDFNEVSVYETAEDLWAFELAWDAPQNLLIDGQPVMADRVSERLRHKDRAITIWDYEHLVLGPPGTTIARASVRPRSAWWSAVGDVAFGEFTSNPVVVELFDPTTPSGLEIESQEDPQGLAYVRAVLKDPAQFNPLDGDEVVTVEVQEEDESGGGQVLAPGTLTLSRTADRWSANLDFSAAGYTHFRVLAEGVGKIYSSSSAQGVAFTSDSWPEEWTVKSLPEGIWIDLGYPNSTPVDFPGGASVTTAGLTIVVEGVLRPPFGAGHTRFLFEGQTTVGVRQEDSVVAVDDGDPSVPRAVPGVELLGAAPNPFNPRTVLSFALARDGHVEMLLHDVAGRRVRTLVNGYRESGRHAQVWDGRDDAGREVASGVYFVHVKALGDEVHQKIVLVR